MRRINYMKRAARKFLAGTRFRTPVDAVEAGIRTLTDWVDALNFERECDKLERAGDDLRTDTRLARVSRSIN